MIDITAIREQPEVVKENLGRRSVDPALIDQLVELDATWRELQGKIDSLRQQKNETNEKISNASEDKRSTLIASMRGAAQEEKHLQEKFQKVTEQRDTVWRSLPNMLYADVPAGSAKDAQEIDKSAVSPSEANQKNYLDLVGSMVELDRAAKVSGSRFVYIRGQLARLELALVSFAFDQLAEAGFEPVIPPVLMREEAMAGMGYLDHEGDEVYRTQDDLYLAGTSEQPIGAMHSNEIFEEAELPRRYVAFSTCFRREAGSHGKDVKGMLRVHQFDKVEMFTIAAPATSEKEHQFLLEQQRALMDALELPYRVMLLAAQDLGSPSAKTYDIETWLPGEGAYRETHSTSNTTDYQSRRLAIRYRSQNGEVQPVHMLNGTAFAIGRILIALVENHQQPDGSITIPAALHPYLPFQTIS